MFQLKTSKTPVLDSRFVTNGPDPDIPSAGEDIRRGAVSTGLYLLHTRTRSRKRRLLNYRSRSFQTFQPEFTPIDKFFLPSDLCSDSILFLLFSREKRSAEILSCAYKNPFGAAAILRRVKKKLRKKYVGVRVSGCSATPSGLFINAFYIPLRTVPRIDTTYSTAN